MPTLEINGRDVEVDDSFLSLTPEQQEQTVDEIAAQIGAASQPAESAQSQDLRSELSGMTDKFAGVEGKPLAETRFDNLPAWQKPLVAAGDMVDLAANGATMGFGNKGAAALRAAFTDKSYDEELEAMRAATQRAGERSGSAGQLAEFAGVVGTPAALASRGATLAGRFGTGAMTGAKGVAARSGLLAAEGAGYGAASALGNDTNVAEGAAVGGLAGGAVPLLLAGGRTVAKPFVDAVRARMNPGGYAAEKVAERVGNKMPADQAAQRMAMDPGTSLADVAGDSTRGLLRTAANIPGKARDRVNAQLVLRQFGQGDRLKSAVARTFADPDGYLATKDQIAEAMEKAAGPMYRTAYSKPLHYSEKLEAILDTPAGKQALRHAETLAQNEQVPFKQFFIQVADDGSQTARRVPDTRGWDYIKRAMDDMIDGQTDSITKKVTNEGRILVGLKNRMLEEVDRLNPDYAAARSVWAGKKSLDEALEKGRDVFRLSPEALRREVANMGPAQKLSARVGAAETLRHEIEQAGMTQNAVLRIFSRRNQIKNLQTLFETPEKFAEFRKAIFAEARKRATYDKVRGNSTTVQQGIDMADAGGLRDSVDLAKNAVTSGPVNATLQFIGSRLRMLGGMTPEVADQVATRLMGSSGEHRARIVAEIARIERLKLSRAEKENAIAGLIARTIGATTPLALAQ
jgi:hypothetical protein